MNTRWFGLGHQVEIWRDIGDWYGAFFDTDAIEGAYRRAINLFEEVDNSSQIAESWFSNTGLVYKAVPRKNS